MNRFHLISYSHRNTDLNKLQELYLDGDILKERLECLKASLGVSEVLYLATCNRIELLWTSCNAWAPEQINAIIACLNPALSSEEIKNISLRISHFQGEKAMEHLFRLSSSLDSLVVGEREIIAQVRKAYEQCHAMGLCGDDIRIAIKKAIHCAKDVYTETRIAENPVSVVSMAYRMLRQKHLPDNAHFLIIGAGQTIRSMTQYLRKHGYWKFSIFNRGEENGQQLATEMKADYYPLSELANFNGHFDAVISCTGAAETVLTLEIYRKILGIDCSDENSHHKVLIDLAVPRDIDPRIAIEYDVQSIEVESLRIVAAENLKKREKELTHALAIVNKHMEEFRAIFRLRCVERAMRDVPMKIKEIRQTAVESVFAKDLNNLDPASREVLEQVINYMEKKYISIPMSMAKEILLKDKN